MAFNLKNRSFLKLLDFTPQEIQIEVLVHNVIAKAVAQIPHLDDWLIACLRIWRRCHICHDHQPISIKNSAAMESSRITIKMD